LQAQKEALIAETLGSFSTRAGHKADEKVRMTMLPHIKRDVTGLSVPLPKQMHKSHVKMGLALGTFLGFVSFRPAAAQHASNVYLYSSLTMWDSTAVGYSSVTESYYAGAHTYRATSTINTPDGRSFTMMSNGGAMSSSPAIVSNYVSIIIDGIPVDGTCTNIGRGEVFCRYVIPAAVFLIAEQLKQEVKKPDVRIEETGTKFDPTCGKQTVNSSTALFVQINSSTQFPQSTVTVEANRIDPPPGPDATIEENTKTFTIGSAARKLICFDVSHSGAAGSVSGEAKCRLRIISVVPSVPTDVAIAGPEPERSWRINTECQAENNSCPAEQ
jgi:hypothetical protein